MLGTDTRSGAAMGGFQVDTDHMTIKNSVLMREIVP